MNPGFPDQVRKPLPVLAIVIGLCSVAFAVGVGVLVFLLVRPKGELAGELSLTEPTAVVSVTGAAGATLSFTSDASVGMSRVSLLSDDQLERQVDRQLRRSMLTVRATTTGGAQRTATCALYNGRSMTTTISSGSLSRTGMLNDCSMGLDQPGPWQVQGSVTWAPELELRSATLELRLEQPAR